MPTITTYQKANKLARIREQNISERALKVLDALLVTCQKLRMRGIWINKDTALEIERLAKAGITKAPNTWRVREIKSTDRPVSCCGYVITAQPIVQKAYPENEKRTSSVTPCLKCQTLYMTPVEFTLARTEQ